MSKRGKHQKDHFDRQAAEEISVRSRPRGMAVLQVEDPITGRKTVGGEVSFQKAHLARQLAIRERAAELRLAGARARAAELEARVERLLKEQWEGEAGRAKTAAVFSNLDVNARAWLIKNADHWQATHRTNEEALTSREGFQPAAVAILAEAHAAAALIFSELGKGCRQPNLGPLFWNSPDRCPDGQPHHWTTGKSSNPTNMFCDRCGYFPGLYFPVPSCDGPGGGA